MRSGLGLTLGLIAAATAAPASAQRAQSEPLLDERAYGLGGAVTGSAAGPAAAYYNPGGLADTGGGTAIGASLSVRSYRSYELEDGYISMLGIEDLNDAGFTSVPIFLGAVLKFGPRDETGLQQHALAAGSMVRDAIDRDFIDSQTDLPSGIASSIEVEETIQTRWFYAAYSVRPDPALAIGLTVAWSYYDYSYRESWNEVTGIGGGSAGRLQSREARVFYDHHHLVIRAGAHWRPSDWVQLGIMVQAPGIPLFGGGSYMFQRATVDETGGSSFFRSQDDQVSPTAPVPWQLRIGGYARLDERLGMALDLGVTGSVGSPNSPILPLGNEAPTDGDLPAATYFADRYWSDVTFDAALGAEIVLHPDVDLRVGTFFELSGLPEAERERDTYMPDRVSHVGGTAAVAVDSGQYDFAIGVGYTYGWGTGLRPTAPLAPTYLGTGVESHQIGFFISGVTSAATQLALDTYRVVTGQDIDVDDEEELEQVQDALESIQAPGLRDRTEEGFEAGPRTFEGVLQSIDRALEPPGAEPGPEQRPDTPPGYAPSNGETGPEEEGGEGTPEPEDTPASGVDAAPRADGARIPPEE